MKNFTELLESLLTIKGLTESPGEDEISIIQNLCTNTSLIETARNWIKNLQTPKSSSTNYSEAFKEAKRSSNHVEKCRLLNKIILEAKEDLGNVFFERGKVLLKCENYKQAYDDFSLTNSSNKKDVGIVYRLAFCAHKNQYGPKLKEHLEELSRYFEKNLATDKELKQIKPEYEKLLEKLPNLIFSEEKKEEKYVDFHHDHVKLCRSKDKGRHVINQDCSIEPGKNIFSEKAFAFVPLNPDGFYTDCGFCAATNVIPYPCSKCKFVYCSLSCLNRDKKIHQYICPGIEKCFLPEIGLGYLALQTYLIGEPELPSSDDVDEYFPIDTENLSFEASQYALMMSLETHLNKLSMEDCISYGLTALIIAFYVQEHTTLHKKSHHLKFTATLILRHICQLVTNAHTINDLRFIYNGQPLVGLNKFENINPNHVRLIDQQIFSAIFPTVSLLNHSCKPNIRNRFNGHELTIFARVKIDKGKELFNNYGLNYHLISTPDRKEVLRDQYHFECRCEICSNTTVEETDELKRLRSASDGKLLQSTYDFDTMELVDAGDCDVKLGETINRTVSLFTAETNLEEARQCLKFCVDRLHPHHMFSYTYMNKFVTWARSESIIELEFQERLYETTKYVHGEASLESDLVYFDILRSKDSKIEVFRDFVDSKIEKVTSDRSCRLLKALFVYPFWK